MVKHYERNSRDNGVYLNHDCMSFKGNGKTIKVGEKDETAGYVAKLA